jgi:hypothetical protein
MASMILRSPNLGDGDEPLVVRIFEKTPPLRFNSGGLARAAHHVRSAGRGGDDILLHINPKEYEFLQHVWGEPSTNPHTGLPEYGLFKKLKKALKFEAFNVKGIVKDIAKNPQRLLTGAVDPLGTKITNKMFGTKYDPVVNQLGGATEQRFRDAEAKGMETGTARGLHKVAGAIAGFYGGNALGNLASTGLSNISSGLQGVANANTLSPAVTTVKYTGDTADFIAPVTTQFSEAAASRAGQAAANAAADSNLVGTLAQAGANATNYGSGALANLGDKAVGYAKDPKNWGTIAKALPLVAGLAGAGGGGSEEPGEGAPPAATPGAPMPVLPFGRSQKPQDFNWYTYGQGPEQSFYDYNQLPNYNPANPNNTTTVPDDKRPWMGDVPGHARGGAMRFVRGPGTGRSDDIDAKLSDGEYVLTAEDVALLGDGSSEAGARRLDEFRRNLRRHKGGALAKGKISPNAKSPMSYLKGAR